MSILGWCNVETVSPPGFQGLSCSKVQGFEDGFFQKLFKGYIFCFLGHLVDGQLFELFARETNLKKKRSVILKWKYYVYYYYSVLESLVTTLELPHISHHYIRHSYFCPPPHCVLNQGSKSYCRNKWKQYFSPNSTPQKFPKHPVLYVVNESVLASNILR